MQEIERKKHRTKILLLLILGILFQQTYSYIRWTNILPLYKNSRSEEAFNTSRPVKFWLFSNDKDNNEAQKKTASVSFETENKTQEKEFTKKETSLSFPAKENIKIIFASPDTTTGNILIAQLSDGTTIAIQAQSLIHIKDNEISLSTGHIQYKFPQQQANKLIYKGNSSDKKEITGEFIGDIYLNKYEQEKETDILRTSGLQNTDNPLIDKRTKKILITLVQINPKKYTANLTNYNKLHQELNTQQESTTIFEEIDNKKTQEDLLQQSQKGFEETQTFQRIQNIKKWFK